MHRTGLLVVLGLLLAGLALYVAVTRRNLDSEVLDLLPQKFESVRGLKQWNTEFSQARQLVFAFEAEPGHADDLDPFREHFMAELKRQPWIVRVFDQVPFQTEDGLREIQKLVPALLLNLPKDEFREALAQLRPEAIDARLTRLRDSLSGDSFRAEYEAQMDPLGLFARAMKPFGSGNGMDQGSGLASPDGLLQIGLAITNQAGLGPKDCQAVMDRLNRFRDQTLQEWPGYKPKVLVTGRTPYVAEISRSMDHDGALSSTLSILIVSGLFYVAFRRFLPLLGICLVLLLSALVSLALGMLILRNLNMIAIAFCSILVGIGVDFSFLLYGRYLQARREGETHERAVFVSVRNVGAAIFFVVVTTAVGFLSLGFSQSAGFAQLGTLVALGVAFAGLFSVLYLFMFFKRTKLPTGPDFMLTGARRFVREIFRAPGRILWISGGVLLAAAVVALAPAIPLKFDTDPRSLEPTTSQASIARRTMEAKLNQESDPVAILVDAKDPQSFHDRWERLAVALDAAQREGKLKNVSTPLALALSPRQIAENRAELAGFDVAAGEAAFRSSLEKNGFDPQAFAGTFDLLHDFSDEKTATGLPEWSKLLPASSSWWFFIDRYFSAKPTMAVGLCRPTEPIQTEADKRQLTDLVHAADPEAVVTGMTFTLFDLVPWARGELIAFTTTVGMLILLLLAVVFRRLSLWFVHSSALALSMLGLVATLKLLHVPINLLNTLAFPLVLAIGVDHGIQFLIVGRREGNLQENLANVLKPLLICAFTAVAGFAVLIPAQNPALSGLGLVCAVGVFWCLLTTFFYIVPAFAWLHLRQATKTLPREAVRV
ncbi:MAG TPA: MMPL family transporter [Chthoniobacterales bacterium]